MTNDFAWMHRKRTQVVWGSFFTVMSAMLVLLQVGGGDIQGGVLLTNISSLTERPAVDPIFSGNTPVESSNWSGIVIQHLGEPAGSVESIHRAHVAGGLEGLGFHFIIGNGNGGLGDGAVHASERWFNQIRSARPVSISPENWNKNVITICLVGNGNRRPFTERQILHLSRLVQRLQNELSIEPTRVWLASDFEPAANMQSSPGKFFAEAMFRSQLLDIASSF